MRRPLLIGQAPCRTGDPSKPLTGAAGRRIAALMGLTSFGYLRRFDRVNVFDRFPGRKGKGDEFPLDAARFRAFAISSSYTIDGARPFVLFFGRKTGQAFYFREPYLVWGTSALFGTSTRCAVVPHPSGINRWWNDPANVRRARRFLRTLPERKVTP